MEGGDGSTDKGDIDAVKSVRQFEVTALDIAYEKGSGETAVLLLDKGDQTDTFRRKGYTALHVMADIGRLDTLMSLLSEEADVNLLGNGYTPLHLSCKHGHNKVAAALLDQGADIDATYMTDDDENYIRLYEGYYNRGTALHLAAAEGKEETVKLLLSRKAAADAVDERGFSALHCACRSGHPEVAEVLLRSGAITTSGDVEGCTALHYAAWNGLEDTVQLLLNFKADVNATTNDGLTPLHYACKFKCPNVAGRLLKSGARVNVPIISCRRTPLHLAADIQLLSEDVENQIELLELLFEWGADVNAEDEEQKTPLMVGLDWSYDCERAIAELFTKQVVKMQVQNMFVSEANLQTLRDHELLKNLSAACEIEFRNMRKAKIGESSVTFFDVLTTGTRRLADHLAEEDVSASGDFETEFPIYAKQILKKFRQAEERLSLQRQSDSVLRSGKFRDVPHVCMEKLNRYLTNEDLNNVIRAKPL